MSKCSPPFAVLWNEAMTRNWSRSWPKRNGGEMLSLAAAWPMGYLDAMHKIWFERALPPEYTHLLAGVAEVIGPASATPDNPLAAIAEADAIIASARIRYDGALMDRTPRLKVIARTGVGYDNVTVPDATARGIAACYTPEAPTIATSEHAVALLLATVKQLKRSNQAMLRGEKSDYMNEFSGMELYQHRLGL